MKYISVYSTSNLDCSPAAVILLKPHLNKFPSTSRPTISTCCPRDLHDNDLLPVLGSSYYAAGAAAKALCCRSVLRRVYPSCTLFADEGKPWSWFTLLPEGLGSRVVGLRFSCGFIRAFIEFHQHSGTTNYNRYGHEDSISIKPGSGCARFMKVSSLQLVITQRRVPTTPLYS